MRSAPRKFSDESALYAAAMRALIRRAYSVHEMKEYLARRAETESLAKSVLLRLRERQYLDDVRYARDYARVHAQSRRQGKFRIARELRARGVPDRHIEAALDSAFAETDEAALVRARLARKLKNLRAPEPDARLADAASATGRAAPTPARLTENQRASLYRSLLRAGFSSDVIRSELRSALRFDPEEIPDI